jgi:hypothetical protein
MKQDRGNIKRGLYLVTAVGLAAASFDPLTNTGGVEAQAVRNLTPLAPSGPAPINDLQSAMRQTAAVVEGVVTDIHYDYSEQEGPWTRVFMSSVRVLLGSAPSTVEISQFGGPLPNGRLMVAAELPVFVLGKTYIVFLRNNTWNVSPVVGDLALRVETVAGSEVLVNSDGQPVTKLGAGGVEVGAALFEGPERIGSPPKALTDDLRSFNGKPLDRQRFVESLQSTMGTQGLNVAGTFSDRPTGRFKWRGQRTARSARASIDPPASPALGTSPEVDISTPTR